ncbi:uncharacterized protein CELE_W02B3.4 [Caenorhabditis elegans]|uniref:Uncharacterized protein W02B3.4 n=1 Tax=Caenorhabditis elegans TaxID=6239 RepID=YR24_CAEEL|nr:Uncharacterized protein CELE_W02B3.4 [Caenorhabditis elegans]Q09341.2 RecName: Full=Uncharacterized protein W02B3.4 [Caenorhabditis elegans]CCD63983.1 Uncharacterized protein CELE_W02B3.4 [Caenorhabditis elegans]|eukprot:NP_497236.2 Uncharacterized protein CELE_W02B3.4 [Caenorhabditis elegans]
MRKHFVLFSFPFLLLSSMLIFYQTTVFRNQLNEENDYTGGPIVPFMKRSLALHYQTCESFLNSLNTTVPVLLIDVDVLKMLDENACNLPTGRPTKIGVDVKYLSATWLLQDSRFEIVYYTNDTEKDFLDFRSEPRKIIPKKFSTCWVENLAVPADIKLFVEFWKRAKFVNCMNLHIPRAGSKVRMPARPSSEVLSRLRDELIENRMFPFLNGGTLLGWYRECSVIPHTLDMDISVFAEDFNLNFVEQMEQNLSDFRIKRKFGMTNDSFELTLAPKTGFKVFIDVFLMYKGVENGSVTHHWVGGVAPDGTKYKYSYPVYDPFCAADLHGHIFWVTCTPNEKIVKEYGQLWYLDHLTSKYSWNSSGKNVKKNGKWTKEQMKMVYKVFKR